MRKTEELMRKIEQMRRDSARVREENRQLKESIKMLEDVLQKLGNKWTRKRQINPMHKHNYLWIIFLFLPPKIFFTVIMWAGLDNSTDTQPPRSRPDSLTGIHSPAPLLFFSQTLSVKFLIMPQKNGSARICLFFLPANSGYKFGENIDGVSSKINHGATERAKRSKQQIGSRSWCRGTRKLIKNTN